VEGLLDGQDAVCYCSCHGANHECLLVGGAKPPQHRSRIWWPPVPGGCLFARSPGRHGLPRKPDEIYPQASNSRYAASALLGKPKPPWQSSDVQYSREVSPVARPKAIVLPREDVRLADYDNGLRAQIAGTSFDFTQPLAWRRGWLEADTHEIGQLEGTQ
jgi:hypothetical protein